MQQEIEATFLGIDHDALRAQLKALGGTCSQPEFLMRRAVFDYSDQRLDRQAAWVRVRQEYDRVTMCYKQRKTSNIDGMYEVEFVVSDYDKACGFLQAIGLEHKARQETKRELWLLDGCQVTLDTWPWIPQYVEIEAPDESSVRAVAQKLGFQWSNALFDSADAVYQRYYDVTRTEISTVNLTFSPVPDWLEAKRITTKAGIL